MSWVRYYNIGDDAEVLDRLKSDPIVNQHSHGVDIESGPYTVVRTKCRHYYTIWWTHDTPLKKSHLGKDTGSSTCSGLAECPSVACKNKTSVTADINALPC